MSETEPVSEEDENADREALERIAKHDDRESRLRGSSGIGATAHIDDTPTGKPTVRGGA